MKVKVKVTWLEGIDRFDSSRWIIWNCCGRKDWRFAHRGVHHIPKWPLNLPWPQGNLSLERTIVTVQYPNDLPIKPLPQRSTWQSANHSIRFGTEHIDPAILMAWCNISFVSRLMLVLEMRRLYTCDTCSKWTFRLNLRYFFEWHGIP